MSYADFITLLFAFFVVLFAGSRGDAKKQQLLAVAIQTAFAQGAFDAHSKTPALAPSAGAMGKPTPIAMPTPMTPEAAARKEAADKKRIYDALAQMAVPQKNQNLPPLGAKPPSPEKRGTAISAVSFRSEPEGLVLSLQDAGFFNSGSAALRADAIPVLERIAASLPMGPLRVEGHTDNVAIHTALYASNWELSTARANAIARVLLARSLVNPASLAVAGYAEFHPISSNSTEEGRAKNRRVDIVLLKQPLAELAQIVSPAKPSLSPTP
ncbi:OmpA/MotB family protein [Terriglobus saanensis]|uniref:OmpA family protein n=1 Tax=Terriglobus saanensis TaxID=870903 RepID=UPI0002E97658